MKDKYYTPDIEEFHVGFELTYYSLGKRVPHIIEEEDITQGDEGGSTNLYIILKSRPLVKYLNEDDFYSLGFTKVFDAIGFIGLQSEEYNILIKKFEDSTILEIIIKDPSKSTWALRTNQYLLFRGSIKNKYELRKLLIQIKQDEIHQV